MDNNRLEAIERMAAQDACVFSGDVRCKFCTKREACPQFRKSVDEYIREDDNQEEDHHAES